MALSRTVRIGIVASVLWIIGFSIHTGGEVLKSGELVQNTHYEMCIQDERGQYDPDANHTACFNAAYDDRMRHVGVAWSNAIPFAFIVLALGWIAVLIAMRSFRWIADGK